MLGVSYYLWEVLWILWFHLRQLLKKQTLYKPLVSENGILEGTVK